DPYANSCATFHNAEHNLDTIRAECSDALLLLAGGPTGSSTLTVLAAAPRADVLFDTGTSNTPHDANGSGWYFNDSWSWGFAKQGDPIDRNTCDVQGDPNPDLRLCLHTGIGFLEDGYRAGAHYTLGDAGAPDFTRYIYQAPVPATQTTPTTPTGQRAAALAKCTKKHLKRARRTCRKRANLLPV